MKGKDQAVQSEEPAIRKEAGKILSLLGFLQFRELYDKLKDKETA